MICASCSAELASDADSCFVCGAEIGVDMVQINESSPLVEVPNAAHFERMYERESGLRLFFQGGGLERAGDIAGALAIYEGLVAAKFDLSSPCERLAIMYRKARRSSDEERFVRAALVAIGDSPRQRWFSERLAKLMVRRGIRDLTRP